MVKDALSLTVLLYLYEITGNYSFLSLPLRAKVMSLVFCFAEPTYRFIPLAFAIALRLDHLPLYSAGTPIALNTSSIFVDLPV